MTSRERIEQVRRARVKWQDVDDLIAALDEREELLREHVRACGFGPQFCDACHKTRDLLRGSRYEVK